MNKPASTSSIVPGLPSDVELNKNEKGSAVEERRWKQGQKWLPPPSGDNGKGCCWRWMVVIDAIKAMITRCMFLFHSLLAIWRVTVVTGAMYWLLTLSFLGLIVETMIVLIDRRGQEWRWFQWSVFLYLCAVIPPIWIIELDQLGMWNPDNSTLLTLDIESTGQLHLPVNLKPQDWVVALEQGLLVLIIIGRWLMPKGDLTRNQLSALLLMHLGTASDIVDCLTILIESEVRESPEMIYSVLGIWTWALCQFPFVVTVTTRESIPTDRQAEPYMENKATRREKTCNNLVKTLIETEVWGICVSVFMQDGPFLALRLIAIFMYDVVTYTNYFFTAKNGLILVLQLYRVISLCIEHKTEKTRKKKEKRMQKRLIETAITV